MAVFKKKPETAALTQLQADLVKAQADAEKARLAAEAAKIAERQDLETQIRAAQQDNLGTVTALGKVAKEHQTPEVKLAQRMAQRVSLKLATAIGRLPTDQQEAMVELIEQALSDKQSEVDAANQKLAALDADFKAVTSDREDLKAEIPKLTQRALKAEGEAKEVQSNVTLATDRVKSQADKLFQADQEAGSLWNVIKGLGGLLFFLACAWVFLAFIVPAILKYMPSNHFKTVLRDVSGVAVGGLHFLDARRKLNDLNAALSDKGK